MASFSSYPFYRCFPAISGFRVSWDSSKQPGQRVQRIWLLEDSQELGPDKKPILVDKDEIFRTSDRELVLVATEYVVEGGDGYNCLTNKKVLISPEGGQIQSSIVRQSLLGEDYYYFFNFTCLGESSYKVIPSSRTNLGRSLRPGEVLRRGKHPKYLLV